MSNLETAPRESTCGGVAHVGTAPPRRTLEPREVPLGGPRGVLVRRTLPHRDIRTIGAWCFADHYGPVDLAAPDARGMIVPPHPHIGLQTVSWLLEGEIEHRDSVGSHQRVRPGELSLMTAGHGIAHSEYAFPGPGRLTGVQLWVALTDAYRGQQPHFEHHAALPVISDGALRATVFLGSLPDQTAPSAAATASPAATYSPLVGAELRLAAGATEVLTVDPDFEYGVLAAAGSISIDGVVVGPGSLHYLGWGSGRITLAADTPAVALLLGGEPLAENLLMWWNFVGRDHDEIVAAREDWEAGRRFPDVVGDPLARLPAPPMPGVRLKPRPSRP